MEKRRSVARIALVLFAALCGWIAVMVGVMRFSDAAPAAVVPLPSRAFLDDLPKDVAILDINDLAVTFANVPDLAATLYKAGAWVVLPAGLTGCLPLTPAQRAALAAR